MRIGVLARESGASIDTIRYYEREGLLQPPRRRASGYRDYDAIALKRLRFIRQAKHLGFSLEDIHELLTLSVDRNCGVHGVKQRAQERLTAVNERMAQLRQVQRGLKQLIASCPGQGPLDECPILQALSDKQSEGRA